MRQAGFHCQTCGEVAVVVARQGAGVETSGFLGRSWRRVEPGQRRQVDRAIRTSDAVALHALHPELQPAWCPGCQGSYCGAHWRREVAGADDHPGWYEATYGTCPEGHRRALDD